MKTISPQEVTGTIELAPNYRIPLFLVILSLPLLFLQVWLGIIFSLLGLFLMLRWNSFCLTGMVANRLRRVRVVPGLRAARVTPTRAPLWSYSSSDPVSASCTIKKLCAYEEN